MRERAFEQLSTLEATHWWFRGRRKVYLELIKAQVEGARLTRVLEVGSGSGGFLPELAQLGQQLHFIEPNEAAASCCAARPEASGARASAAALPFQDRSLDLICLFDVLEHIEDDLAALREVRRCLRPGGHLALSVPAHPWLYSNNDRVSGHYRRYRRRELVRLVQTAGFRVKRKTFANVLLSPLILPLVLGLKAVEKSGLISTDSQHTNLSLTLPRPLNELLYRVFALELRFSRRRDLPLGHSILLIAERD